MKKILFFLPILILFTFNSCDVEPLDSGILSQNNGNNNGNNNGGSEGSSTGDYWPRAIGNVWNFDDTYYGNITYEMVTTEQINGNTYYKFDDLFGQEAWLRKSGDSYYVRNIVSGFPIDGYDVTTTSIEVKMLKDSAEVGETWSSTPSYTISYTPNMAGLPEIPDIDFSATYDFEMIERDATMVVESVEYVNVLHVRLTVTALGSPASVYEYFYARDIGLIKYDGTQSSGVLLSYTLN